MDKSIVSGFFDSRQYIYIYIYIHANRYTKSTSADKSGLILNCIVDTQLLHCFQYNMRIFIHHNIVKVGEKNNISFPSYFVCYSFTGLFAVVVVYGDGYIYAMSADAKTVALISLSDNFAALASPELAGRRLLEILRYLNRCRAKIASQSPATGYPTLTPTGRPAN